MCVLMCSCNDFLCGVCFHAEVFCQVSTKTGKWQATQIEMFGFPIPRDAIVVTKLTARLAVITNHRRGPELALKLTWAKTTPAASKQTIGKNSFFLFPSTSEL
jgi:hypothetical protein